MIFTSFEPTRNVQDFHLAAFAYYDGLDVIDQLKPGTPVQLVGEPSNPHDSEAVAIFYQGTKLGYIPSDKNSLISRLIYFGHGDILEARIQMSNTENHPDRQFRVVVKLKDNRKNDSR
ncbi:HIRAN domain-containing protein [Streptococcus suis]|uniref:Restriction endonuclease n=1 Tax=Streptococcus suis TaxID=1307 RepID=A0A4T2GZV2_STRSU|nr:HIRAN domain-containing protein [Streptococcus suis]MBY4965628.1 HIRAN domain-containing protein [Streptococcus suis]MBY5014494.1 HIRAN domain-containing protein [Streptococcus suis]MBY5029841.1 HIRAN domain-containing protein [Streptococcus suis]MDW8776927.1 HIRAN domain-containing protein [Streptococcus suis]NQN65206.1 restriction endonuclease [Streptococcus suis]